MKIERILPVTGGRHYSNRSFVRRMLTEVEPDLVIHGGATGADALADEWAHDNYVPRLILSVPRARWNQYGKRAGRMRNANLADITRQLTDPDSGSFGLAFPGDTGTANMIEELLARDLVLYDLRDVEEAQ